MDEGKEGKSSEDEISNIKKSRVVKDKERGVEKIWGEEKKKRVASKGKDPESSKRLAEGNSCGLSADEGRY